MAPQHPKLQNLKIEAQNTRDGYGSIGVGPMGTTGRENLEEGQKRRKLHPDP